MIAGLLQDIVVTLTTTVVKTGCYHAKYVNLKALILEQFCLVRERIMPKKRKFLICF